jgi:hypothetical protein
MTFPIRRPCPWLTDPKGTAITLTPAAWWVVITRDPRATRFRAGRTRRIALECRAQTASQG